MMVAPTMLYCSSHTRLCALLLLVLVLRMCVLHLKVKKNEADEEKDEEHYAGMEATITQVTVQYTHDEPAIGVLALISHALYCSYRLPRPPPYPTLVSDKRNPASPGT